VAWAEIPYLIPYQYTVGGVFEYQYYYIIPEMEFNLNVVVVCCGNLIGMRLEPCLAS
jgi:hypothetical protein